MTDFTPNEIETLVRTVEARIRKKRREHASPRAEERRRLKGITPFGDKQDLELRDIALLQKLADKLRKRLVFQETP